MSNENNEKMELNLNELDEVSGGKSGKSGHIKTTGNVYVRKGPGLDYATITSVPSGTKLAWTGATATDERGVLWYKVENSKGQTGWVSSKYAKKV